MTGYFQSAKKYIDAGFPYLVVIGALERKVRESLPRGIPRSGEVDRVIDIETRAAHIHMEYRAWCKEANHEPE